MSRICPNCHNECDDNSAFCSVCGCDLKPKAKTNCLSRKVVEIWIGIVKF